MSHRCRLGAYAKPRFPCPTHPAAPTGHDRIRSEEDGNMERSPSISALRHTAGGMS